ncbi:hypothetical protein A7Q01_09035 [Eikenella sp. NML96-A-049]|uniref:RDD family protein n=1 Tax=unclassified Eikenella TaxID=2639367 RepID=UPI0007E29316|nr:MULTISPECIES: RDD family protein [unclassified Eikenella]OAM34780.1 hypothetical protein A7P97_06380 [Eikenella sp. NML070372]OAM39521.1 hypothetical protein A7Q01_09035 [Eikenella sp. NML96-A-049]VDG99879.1 RDD family [Helicobacter pametensis]
MRDFRKPNFNSQIGEEIKQVFRSAVLEDEPFDEDGINVELAAPWRRIAAAALNLLMLLLFTIGVGFIVGLVGSLFGSNFGNPVLIGYGAMLAYVIGQAMLMANSGQSLGKRIMGIRVISEDGSEPSLVQYLLLREAVILLPLAILLKFIPLIGGMLSLVVAAACILMMFMEDGNRRTGQDMLAKTLVIRD